MKVYDLENLGTNKVSFYLALEEYLLNSGLDEDIFFIWRIDKSIISGRNQLLESEINLEYAKSIGCSIYRRPSGGGTVFADEGCFMYSYITKEKNRDNVYNILLNHIYSCLNKLGLEIKFSGRNDLMYLDKKFSGTAFYQNEHGSILHGTFLYDTNFDDLVKCLTPNDLKLISKGINSVKERVINLKNFLKIPKKEVIFALESEFLGSKIKIGEDELKIIKQLEIKYLEKSWIFDKKPPYTYINKDRFACGEIEVLININHNKIKNISFLGDFFSVREIKKLEDMFINQIYDLKNIEYLLSKININEFIVNLKKEELIKLLFGGN